MSILVKFSKDFLFWSTFSKNFDFGKKIFSKYYNFRSNFRKKIPILVILSKNFDFGQSFRKISILVKFSVKFSIKISINLPKFLVKIFKNFEKIRFQSNFRQISIFVKFPKNFEFASKFSKNIWKFSKNIDLGQILEKFRFGSKFSKNFACFENSE